MQVISTTLATDFRTSPSKHPLLERLLRAALPAANPDFEACYQSVHRWWIEIDNEGVPQRELGMNAAGKMVVAGPLGNNTGFWTDSSMKFEVAKYESISHELFNAEWLRFEMSYLLASAG